MSDKEIVDKVKKTGAQLVLIYMVAPLGVLALAWLFSTVIATQKNTEVIGATLPLLVVSMDKNTRAIVQMDEGNNAGHSAIATMLHAIEIEAAKNNARLDTVESYCNKYHDELEKCKEHVYQYPNGGQ